MEARHLPRCKVTRAAHPDYPDMETIPGDRRHFLKLLGGLVLGTAAGLTTGCAHFDPPAPGNMMPPEPHPGRAHLPQDGDPEEVPRPGDPVAPPEEQSGLEGDIAAPADPVLEPEEQSD